MKKLTYQDVVNNPRIEDKTWTCNYLVLEVLLEPAKEVGKMYKTWKAKYDEIGDEAYDQTYQDFLSAIAPLFYYKALSTMDKDYKEAYDHLNKIAYLGYGTPFGCWPSLYIHRNNRCFCYHPCKS